MTEAIATLENVAQAMEELKAAGAKITVSSIRAHIGGGSQVTITKHLRHLRSSAGPTAEVSTYPEAFLQAFDAVKAPAWEAARREATRLFEGDRAAFARCTKDDQEDLIEAAQRIDQLESQSAEMRTEMLRLIEEHRELQQRLSSAKDEISRLKALELELKHRAEAAEVALQAKRETIALLREIGIREISVSDSAVEQPYFSSDDNLSDTAIVDEDDNIPLEANGYLVATGRA